MAAGLVLRVLGLVVAGAVVVIGLPAGGIYFVSTSRLNQKVDIPTESIAIPTDITAVQRGQHLASAVAACAECHAPNLAGRIFLDDPLVGRIVAPNLTRGRGGVGATFTNADFVRAIRDGIDPTGRLLLVMPADDYNYFSDADLGDIIAYIRSLPAIDTSLPANEIKSVGLILFTFGQLPLLPAANIDRGGPRPASPPTGITAEYGRYLADAAGCPRCHGPGLSGGPILEAQSTAVPAANITPAGLGAWSEADFIKAMRTGIRPDGHAIGPSMPWPYFAQLTDDELRAMWRFLQAVPPRPTGTH